MTFCQCNILICLVGLTHFVMAIVYIYIFLLIIFFSIIIVCFCQYPFFVNTLIIALLLLLLPQCVQSYSHRIRIVSGYSYFSYFITITIRNDIITYYYNTTTRITMINIIIITILVTIIYCFYPPVNSHDDPGRQGLRDQFPINVAYFQGRTANVR